MIKFTQRQSDIIGEPEKNNLLISASAGTGKTTVMIERIYRLIKARKISVSDVMVVTFTNLAAAEMKNKLVEKLSADKEDSFIAEQLLKVDTAAISTLHSLCCDIVREFFYIADVDPSFSILDDISANSLREACLSDVLQEFYMADDEVFQKLYAVFSRGRREDSLKSYLLKLWDFSRCQAEFYEWYKSKAKISVTF